VDLRTESGDDLPLCIENGRILFGVIKKQHAGTSSGGIVDILARDRGGTQALRFMGEAQRITKEFLLQRGHHVGIKDVMLSKEGHQRVNNRLEKAFVICNSIQKEVTNAPSDPFVCNRGEAAILRILGKTLLQTGSIVNEHMTASNAIRCMVTSGSKGSFINLSQICGSLGQQSLEGGRIQVEKSKVLPFFKNNDDSLQSKGLVVNSFSLGLNPCEFFFHAIGGREGLVDTAVKTSQSGYIQRRMNKLMEDCVVRWDGTVRNANNDIVSFKYGSDGFNPCKVERMNVHVLNEDEETLRKRFTKWEFKVVSNSIERVMMVKTHPLVVETDTKGLVPFNAGRIKKKIKAMSRGRNAEKTDSHVTQRFVEERLRRCIEGVEGSLFALVLVDTLCFTSTEGLERDEFDLILSKVMEKRENAVLCTGESVGCIAAQSIGEPATQMTLNTFHTAGCASKNVTLGIPRLKQLLDASKTSITPCVTIRLKPLFRFNFDFAKCMSHTLPLTRLGDIVSKCEILLDPHDTVVEEDEWMVRAHSALKEGAREECCSHVVRLTLNQDVMNEKMMTPPMIRSVLSERLKGKAIILSSETRSMEWVIRIKFFHISQMIKYGNMSEEMESILCHRTTSILLERCVVGGHPTITNCTFGEVSVPFTDKKEYVLYANAPNFLMDSAACECVDWERTTTNDVWEAYNTLGVEASAHVLFDELKNVISFDGTYVDDRHILMVVDNVCRSGNIIPLNRHGVSKTNMSPFMKASFEETGDVLCEAAVNSCSDNGNGVSSCIMLGQLSNLGTGSTNIFFKKEEETKCEIHVKRTGRVLRSTCRSFIKSEEETETIEYVAQSCSTSSRHRTLSPPTVSEERQRKRARFRPVSPKRG
jgi:DNA-directed RNA polymerase II subunit RPB1